MTSSSSLGGATLTARKLVTRSMTKASATMEHKMSGQIGQPAACMIENKGFLPGVRRERGAIMASKISRSSRCVASRTRALAAGVPAIHCRCGQLCGKAGCAVRQPAMQEKLAKLGYQPVGSTSAQLAAAQRADLARWEKPIKATGVSLD